jgi:hypothetical protein
MWMSETRRPFDRSKLRHHTYCQLRAPRGRRNTPRAGCSYVHFKTSRPGFRAGLSHGAADNRKNAGHDEQIGGSAAEFRKPSFDVAVKFLRIFNRLIGGEK